MIFYLPDKFAEKTYKFVEIDYQVLTESRAEEILPCDETIVGSEDFQVVLFIPGSEIFKASPHLSLCDLCVLMYGSSKRFKEYEYIVKQLKSTLLRLQILKTFDQNDDIPKNNNDFVVPGTICAIAAFSKSNGLSE